jgi:xanthine dehydrogenase YagS FAD-binding subunit
MRPFEYQRAGSGAFALQAFSTDGAAAPAADIQYLAGGTTLLDLMKLNVMRPSRLVDINHLAEGDVGLVELIDQGLYLGALARMADVADHAGVRERFPVVAQSLELAASAQIRNMATLGGNVLQRTRCSYFRDVSYANCNKRNPGSGCAALEGVNRSHAVLGTTDNCIATYAGDFAQAMIALDAIVEVAGRTGRRRFPFEQLHTLPGDAPHIETSLAPGDLITSFRIPVTPFGRRSLYLKVRDRESYEFALASAAVALDLRRGEIRDARIALGGVATIPWRARKAEAELAGRKADTAAFRAAAEVAFAGATPHEHNAFKVELGKRTLVRALQEATALEI